jgi:hypothetical protein
MNDNTRIKLENILLTFGSRVLDVANNKENPAMGELIDKPVNEIIELYAKDVLPKSDALIQDMINLHANMKADYLRLSLTTTQQGGEKR